MSQFTTTFSLLYKTLVRPFLEYVAPVWNPYLVKDIHAIDSVQRRASRLALRQKRGDMSYEERCDMLHWPSLSSRRTYSSLVECYIYCLAYRTWILRNSLNSQKSNPLGRITRISFIVNYLELTVSNIIFLTM